MRTTIRVRLGGNPLIGATLTAEPEAFLADFIPPVSSTADGRGNTAMEIDRRDLPGVRLGVYNVSVSKIDDKGEETVPVKYNEKSDLGLEIGPEF